MEVSESVLSENGYFLSVTRPIGKAGHFGFVLREEQENIPCVVDSYYGPLCGRGIFMLEDFFPYLASLEDGSAAWPTAEQPKCIRVSSLKDAEQVLQESALQEVAKKGNLLFRGQGREYGIRREIPNPLVCDRDGFERLLLPGWWRNCPGDVRLRTPWPGSIFRDNLGDDIIYHDIDIDALRARNTALYGPHFLSDLADFPDEESQEYWRRFNLKMTSRIDQILVEQHYGMPTPGLDVTFDLATAFFFATHRFSATKNAKLADFIRNESHKNAVVYCLFIDRGLKRPLNRTEDLIHNVPLFGKITPTRPLRQQCALPTVRLDGINEFASYIELVLQLSPDFDTSDLPAKEVLFPNVLEDHFYWEILDKKKRQGDIEWLRLKTVPNYKWSKFR